MTQELIEQKKQQLKQLLDEIKALTKELAEAGAIELPEADLAKAAGGSDDDDEFHIYPTMYDYDKKHHPNGEFF